MLLAVDAGNTETVIGLFEDPGGPSWSTTGGSPPTPSAPPTSSRCCSRSSSAFHGFRFDTDVDRRGRVLERAPGHRRPARDEPSATSASPRRRPRARREDRHADPLRQPEGGRRRPHRQRRRRARARTSRRSSSSTSRHGHDLRRHLGQGRVPRRRHRPRHRDQPRRPVRPGRAAARRRAGRAPQRDRAHAPSSRSSPASSTASAPWSTASSTRIAGRARRDADGASPPAAWPGSSARCRAHHPAPRALAHPARPAESRSTA